MRASYGVSFVSTNYDLDNAWTTAILHGIWHYIEQCYNSTQLYSQKTFNSLPVRVRYGVPCELIVWTRSYTPSLSRINTIVCCTIHNKFGSDRKEIRKYIVVGAIFHVSNVLNVVYIFYEFIFFVESNIYVIDNLSFWSENLFVCKMHIGFVK